MSIPKVVLEELCGKRLINTLKTHFKIASVQGMGLESYTLGTGAAGALLSYLKEQKKNDLKHIVAVKPRRINEFAELDPASIRNLELLHQDFCNRFFLFSGVDNGLVKLFLGD